MKKILEESILSKIESICNQGREAWANGKIEEAEGRFLEAWGKIPRPQSEYDYSQELAFGMAVFYRDNEQFDKALQWMPALEDCYNTKVQSNSELSFLAATIHFGAGNEKIAYDLFHKLYIKFGRRPFQGEDHKYFSFYKSVSESK